MFLMPAGSFSEMLTVLCFLFLGIQAMLSNFQMLIISICTDVCVSIALVNETAESDIMARRPRKINEPLVGWKLLFNAYLCQGMMMFIGATVNFFWYCSDRGLPYHAVFNGFRWGTAYPDTNLTTNPSGLYYGIDTSVELPSILNTAQSVFFVSLIIIQ
jgi:sodium/potassium-transporting ATPase subunit alpha